jgi:hypothetical protein
MQIAQTACQKNEHPFRQRQIGAKKERRIVTRRSLECLRVWPDQVAGVSATIASLGIMLFNFCAA